MKPYSTFSIVGYDPTNEDLGIAVQSKFFAVGSVVPWAEAGIGAIATQSWANTTYGPRGLELLKIGLSTQQALNHLIEDDPDSKTRQVGLINAQGNVANYTGEECHEWAGAYAGKYYSAQGNLLTGEEVVKEMGLAFEKTDGELADKLVAALVAGQKSGGDKRGQQSAALLVVRQKGGYGGFNDRYIDLRVDDAEKPIQELDRLLKIHKQLIPR
ncbi:DUF1028 domain-containing protein [Candidatus Poribacteria bacterium]|nr:DUF1028 domain-containing protein [Candidatus Poribacteria bacterium]